ncbi:hypothetical protein IQ07DRAFT_39531 [Pyrenochaeta sp. DS3sAY3a]|nr:hypothetical protein IQ07DRAFT_39531 [Pyrenochaeta sp. DS3sAY3a]
MTLLKVFPSLLLAQKILALPPPTTTDSKESSLESQPSNGWSRESVLTLIGVCAAVICFMIGLGWPYLQTWLYNVLRCIFDLRLVNEVRQKSQNLDSILKRARGRNWNRSIMHG